MRKYNGSGKEAKKKLLKRSYISKSEELKE